MSLQNVSNTEDFMEEVVLQLDFAERGAPSWEEKGEDIKAVGNSFSRLQREWQLGIGENR